MKKKTTLFLVGLLGCTIAASGANDTTVVALQDVNVDAVVVKKQFPGTARTLVELTGMDINRLPVGSLDDVLKSVPGVDIRKRGVGATQADISLRGGSFDQVLVLLNGVSITDPQTGHYNLDIPLDIRDVSRIEVLQGASARRYGNQAFSGAVNFVTDPAGKPLVNATVSGGSFGTLNAGLSVGLGKKSVKHFTSVAYRRSDGYRVNTDYENFNLFSQTAWNSGNAGQFDLQLALQEKSFGANGFYSLSYPNQFDHTQTGFGALNWQKKFGKLALDAQASYRRHYDRFELYRNFEGASPTYTDHNYHLTEVSGASATARYDVFWGRITGGMEWKYDHIYSTVLGKHIENEADRPVNPYEDGKFFTKEDGRMLYTGFLDYSGAWNNFSLSAGASYTYSEAYGLQQHYGLDLSCFFTGKTSVFVSLNNASRLPTFTDLYYKSPTQTANPDLQPETSLMAETGLRFRGENFSAGGGVFYRKGSDIIDWVKSPEETVWRSMNIASLNTAGFDAVAAYSFSGSVLKSLRLSYNFMNSGKQDTEYDSKYALDYLRHQILFQVNHDVVKHVSATWNISYNDRAGNYTDPVSGEMMNYKPYILADVRVAWTAGNITVFGDVNNILNKQYVDFGGLPLPGIAVNGGIRWMLNKN